MFFPSLCFLVSPTLLAVEEDATVLASSARSIDRFCHMSSAIFEALNCMYVAFSGCL
jgi:hypothetical protein